MGDIEKPNRSSESVSVKAQGIIVFLLVVLVLGIGYLCVSDFRSKNSSDTLTSTNRVLTLSIHANNENFSDSTQVKNALNNGGMIILKSLDYTSINEAFRSLPWTSFGANNKEGYVFLEGALLNYIASQGWTLIQAPATGLGTMYFFTR